MRKITINMIIFLKKEISATSEVFTTDISNTFNGLEILKLNNIEDKFLKKSFKILAFLILTVHWFNPLVWIAFRLMSMDMEFSCDEQVLKEVNIDIKKYYANSLLSFSTGTHFMKGGPLAFGEGNVKSRIKNVLNYKKPPFWIIVISALIVVSIFIGLMANPKSIDITDGPNVINGDDSDKDIDISIIDNSYTNKPLLDTITLVPTLPELSLDQPVGVDMVELNYASDDIVIFHDYFGLFVYDLNIGQIIRSLDLKPINCHYTQGDYYCVITVSMDGNTVQLHPISGENMYIYTVSDNSLQEAIYEPDKTIDNSFGSQFVSIDEVVNSANLGLYSHHAVRFSTDDYGYIYTEDGTIGRLSYVRGDRAYKLFDDMLQNHSVDPSVIEERSLDKLIGENVTDEDDDYNLIIPGFSEDEIVTASEVVEVYFQAVYERDNEAAKKALTTSYLENHSGNVYDEGETLTLLSIDYSEDDNNERMNFAKSNNGKKLSTDIEDIILLRVSFNVELSEGVVSPFDEGVTNWIAILVRDGNEAPWLIANMGYR